MKFDIPLQSENQIGLNWLALKITFSRIHVSRRDAQNKILKSDANFAFGRGTFGREKITK